MATEVWIIFALIVLNGILSGAEMAIVTIRSTRVRDLLEAKVAGSRALHGLREKPERFLATVQVGITLVSALAAAYGGASLTADVAGTLVALGLGAATASSVAFALVVATITLVSVILGELVPKSLALRHAEKFALVTAPVLQGLAAVFAPLIWLLTGVSNLLLRPFGDRTTFTESRLSREEIRALVDEASDAGEVDATAGEIASRALALESLTASEVMVHRRFVTAVSHDADADQLRQALLDAGHRRLPVYAGSIDSVVGYIAWRDAVECLWEGRPVVLRELMREALLVPEGLPALQLLKDMQSRRQHIAFVIDEHGGFAGIVTLEDLLEEIVGEIVSEHDEETPSIRAQPDGSFLVLGTSALRDVDRELGLSLDKLDDSTTLGGLCVALAGGHVPPTGQVLQAGNQAELRILDASLRRVRLVRIQPVSEATPAASAPR